MSQPKKTYDFFIVVLETANNQVHILVGVDQAGHRLSGRPHILLVFEVARGRLEVEGRLVVVDDLEQGLVIVGRSDELDLLFEGQVLTILEG